MNVAQQVYDYVDQRIRRLDKDIKTFDSEIGKQRALLGLPVRTPCFCAFMLAADWPGPLHAIELLVP